MEHPLIGNISELTIDELQEKVNELNKKLGIAARIGNAQLCDQIRMAIETYGNKLREKQNEQYKSATQQDFNDKINIS
jgi:hypothetical protein